MSDLMRSYSVTVTVTPRQAMEAEAALQRMARIGESGRLYAAASRVAAGLIHAGWQPVNVGTEDEPRWGWER